MRLLLDTCVLLWLVGDPGRISPRARSQVEQIPNELCISAISAFEIAIKVRKGKLTLPLPPRDWFHQALLTYGVKELSVSSQIAGLAPEVSVPHADPCDRIIVATAQVHGIPVLTPDHLIRECQDIPIIW